MNVWHASTAVLYACWTAWLLVALWLLRRPLSRIRWILLVGFGGLGLLLELTVALSWRDYLMAWLGAHAVLAAAIAVTLAAERRLQALSGLASLAGLILLWVQGGAGEWQYVTWILAFVVCLGAGFGLCWATVLRAEQQKTTVLNDRLRRANDMYQQQSQRARTAERQLQQASGDCRAERRRRRSAEDELTSLRASYDRVHRELGELRSFPRQPAAPGVRPDTDANDAESRPEIPGTGAPAIEPQASAVTVRFFLVPDPDPGPSQSEAPGRVRLGIERTVASVPKGQLEPVSASPAPPSPGGQQAATASSEGPVGRITSAAAASLATELTKPLLPGDRWLSTHSYALPEIADALHEVPGWLHQLVADPAQHVAPSIGLPSPAGLAIGTVADQAAFRSVTAPMAQAARCCEIAGVVVGTLTGLHPVAAVCVKMLAHDEVTRALTRHLTDLIRDPGWKIDSPDVPEPRPPAPEIEEPPPPKIPEPPAPRPGRFDLW